MSATENTSTAAQPLDNPYAGRQVVVDGRNGTITNRVKGAYYVNFDGTREGAYVAEDAVHEAFREARRVFEATSFIDVRQLQAKASAGDVRSKATLALVDLEAMREGGEPAALTPAERATLLARLTGETEPAARGQTHLNVRVPQSQTSAPDPQDYNAGVKALVVDAINRRRPGGR